VKKIYINGKFFAQRVTGTQRYAREVLRQIDELAAEENYRNLTFEVLIPRSAVLVPRYSNLHIRTVGRLHGTAWEQLELPRYCRDHLLLTLSGGAPIFHSRNVITIHDAAVFAAPGGYSMAYRIWYRSLYRRMARTAVHILTNSQFSRSEIVKWCGASPEKITITYLGSEHLSYVRADLSVLRRLGISGVYVLAASSHNPNKNFARISQALGYLASKGIGVVIAGGRDRKVYAEQKGLVSGICTLGYVSDEKLKALYENAACFVFASLYEGFGLPPLEAIASGCPIVVSRVAALPEVFGGVAVFCDPYSAEDIGRAVEQALQSPPASPDELRQFAGKYSWRTCARETLGAIRSL
jgi:glycosyltransferase involved in cell wall biosynthesis